MKLEEKFLELKEKGEGALMPHVYYGDPYEDFSMKLIKTLVENCADLIEFGIPFSDPTADGPTFQAACERSLKHVTPTKCIEGMKELEKSGVEIPFIVTTYYNIPYVVGVGAFLDEIKKAGAQGLIVPDLPIEEAENLVKDAEKRNLHVILQVAPTTTEERLKKITDMASGFLYVINIEGVTGARETLSDSTLELVGRIRRHTDLPILSGFGISKRDHAIDVVSAGANGVVVGSAFAKIYEKNINKPEKTLREVAQLARQIKRGCIEGYRKRLNT